MSTYISMGVARRNLSEVLAKLSLGETATLADENGVPIALLVSLQPTMTNSPPKEDVEISATDFTKDLELIAGAHDLGKKSDDWIEQMKALAKRVDAAWQGDKSGLEELAEMRR